MASAEEYAAWIVQNADKRGSPEFETVAQAYQMAKGGDKTREFKESEHLTALRQSGVATDPTIGMSGIEKFLAGYGSALPNLAAGVGQRLGLVDQASIDERRRMQVPLMATGAGMAGNIAGNVGAALPLAPAIAAGASAAAPAAGAALGANTLANAAISGAALGAAQPTATGESAGLNALIGGAAGAGGNLLGRGLARIISPKTGQAARELMDSGVDLTPGQVLGPVAKRAEDALTSVPLLGDAIRSGQRSAVESFNKSIGNKVLSPIGESVPKEIKAGHEMVRYVGDKLDDAYKTLLPNMQAIADRQFVDDLMKLSSMSQNMADGGKQFSAILNRELYGKMAPNGGMAGQTVKEIESQLGKLARDFSGAADGNQRMLGAALREAQSSLRSLVERSNPAHAELLQNINAGWAMLTRMETAAARAGSKEGIFSPAALRSAVKQMDKSVRDRATARGTALMQDLAERAESVIGPTVPDSGTPYRLMAAAAVPAYFGNPLLAGSVAAGAAGYGTSAGRAAMRGLLSSRPEGAQAVSEAVRRYLVPAAPALANPLYAR